MKFKKYLFYGKTNSGLVKGLKRGAWAMAVLALLVSCSKDFDTYYERPDWLEGSAYEVLERDGNFTNYLKLVDKTLYSKVIRGSGSYTFFAPDDEAFERFFAESAYASVDDIPVSVATDMVAYSMIYNKYEAQHLGDVWTSDREWELGASVKKSTPSYKSLYKERIGNADVWLVDGPDYLLNWHNYRYLPIFTPTYFSSNGFNPTTDYKQFFPSSNWGTHGNVLDAEIVKPDIKIENGVIHQINKVITPLPNFDDLIVGRATTGQASEGWAAFKELLYHKLTDGSYQFVQYIDIPYAAEYYKKMYPDSVINNVYTKMYQYGSDDNLLLFCPNIEEYTGSVRTSENTGYTLFMPSERAIKEYVANKLLKYTDDFNKLSRKVLATFINAHMVDGFVWPSIYRISKNSVGEDGEYINGVGPRGPLFDDAKVTASRFVSNGMVYNIDRVIESGMFESVYGRMLLDPAYSYSNDLLDRTVGGVLGELLKTRFSGYTEENFTLLLTSDRDLIADGYKYNEETASYQNDNVKGAINASARMSRLIYNGVIARHSDYPLDLTQPSPLGDAYGGYGFAVNYYGDMLRYKNGKVQAVGNILDGNEVTITKDEAEYVNGQVYTMDGLLNYSPRNTRPGEDEGWNDRSLVAFIDEYLQSAANVSVFKAYWDVVKEEVNSTINAAYFYTVLIPINVRMEEAIAAGHLPAIDQVKLENKAEFTAAVDFVNSHLLTGGVYPDDGEKKIFPGNYDEYKASTSFKANVGTVLVSAKTSAWIKKDLQDNCALEFQSDSIKVGKDLVMVGYGSENGSGKVIRGLNVSNVMGPKAVLHQFDGYICFGVNPNYESK